MRRWECSSLLGVEVLTSKSGCLISRLLLHLCQYLLTWEDVRVPVRKNVVGISGILILEGVVLIKTVFLNGLPVYLSHWVLLPGVGLVVCNLGSIIFIVSWVSENL